MLVIMQYLFPGMRRADASRVRYSELRRDDLDMISFVKWDRVNNDIAALTLITAVLQKFYKLIVHLHHSIVEIKLKMHDF